MITTLIFITCIGLGPLAAWYIWFRTSTAKRLAKHQREWDKIKTNAITNGIADAMQLHELHYMFLKDLNYRIYTHDCIGKCYPRF